MNTLDKITSIMKDGKEYTINELSQITGLNELEIGRCLEDHPLKFIHNGYVLNPSCPSRHGTYYKLSHIL